MKESALLPEQGAGRAHLLGYVGVDNVGLAGSRRLRQGGPRREGKLLVQTDARASAFSRLERPPTAGGSLELTIDEQLQYIAERELRPASRRSAPTAAAPWSWTRTPARSSRWRAGRRSTRTPTTRARGAARRNRAVQDIYEPGSTFKVVTACGGARRGVMPPTRLIDTSPA